MLSVKTPIGTINFGYERRCINLRSCGLTEVPVELKGEQFGTLDLSNSTWSNENKIDRLPVWLCGNDKLTRIYWDPAVCPRTIPVSRIPFHLQPDCEIILMPGSTVFSVWSMYKNMAHETRIATIAPRATEICVALQELGLPAYVTYILFEEYFPPNSIRMWAKWELITAVKHFHDRRKE